MTRWSVRLAAHDTVAAACFFDAIGSPEERRSAAERFAPVRHGNGNERKSAVFGELATRPGLVVFPRCDE